MKLNKNRNPARTKTGLQTIRKIWYLLDEPLCMEIQILVLGNFSGTLTTKGHFI